MLNLLSFEFLIQVFMKTVFLLQFIVVQKILFNNIYTI